MTGALGDPTFGWGEFGGYSMQSGQTIRMGLTWPGDAGPVYLTAASLTIPTTLVRESSIRELNPGTTYSYQTTEWITVTATSSIDWIDDIVLSYLGTYKARDLIGSSHDIEPPAWRRFHVVAIKGLVLGWLKVTPPAPGQPVPVIAAARDDHTLHLDVEIDTDTEDPDEMAELLSSQL